MATVTGGGGGAWMVTGATASFLVGDLAVLEDGEVTSMAKSARAGPAVCASKLTHTVMNSNMRLEQEMQYIYL